jgi:hypothetical protein
MKKIFFLQLLIGISLFSYSQQFEGGVLLGFTGSQIDGDGRAGYNKLGLEGGGFVRRQFSKRFAWQMELKYIGKGATQPTNPDNPTIYNVSLHYIELPLLLQFRISEKTSVEAGIAAAYLFSSSNDLGLGPEAPNPPFNKYDFPWIGGISYFFTDKFSVNVKFSYSIVPIRGTTDEYHLGGQFNHQLCFGVYYKIK